MEAKQALLQGVVWLSALLFVSSGTAQTTRQRLPMPSSSPDSPIQQAKGSAYSLTDLIRLSLENNPNLRQAGYDIDAAQGRAFQAGQYPNPTLTINGDEMGSPLGPGGVITAPQLNQEIVTGNKLGLSRSVAAREVDQSSLALTRQRFVLLTAVRQGYFAVLSAQKRIAALTQLVDLATAASKRAEKLFETKQIAEGDKILFRIELKRLQADLEGARQEQEAAWLQLTAVVGVPELPFTGLTNSLEAALPDYHFDQSRDSMLEIHPEVRSAQVGITRAQLALRRAEAEPIPNVTIGAGYVRHNKDREDDWMFQVGMPLPVFNRNQGNIRATQAEIGRAVEEVRRVQNDLINRLANAFGQYAAARKRLELYRPIILDDARRSYDLTLKRIEVSAEIGDVLLLLQAQRTIQETNLEYIRAQSEAWRAASEIAGLLLEDSWPPSITPCHGQHSIE